MLENVYKSIARFIQHLKIQKQNAEQYKEETGASGDDLTEITNDADVADFLIETCDLADEFKKTANGIKGRFFSTKSQPPAGEFMIAPDTTSPAAIIAGAIGRSRERDQRFLHSKTMTEAARIGMDLVGEEPGDISENDIIPSIEAHAAVTGYLFALVVFNRHKADMYEVQIQRAGTTKWETVKNGTGKAVNVVIEPTEPGKAEQILVRIQLKKANENYGMPSNPVYVTVNP